MPVDPLRSVKDVCEAPPEEPVESDPNVTSTVNEIDLAASESDSEKTEKTAPGKPPLWRISVGYADDTTARTGDVTPTTTHEFENPELEFDDEFPELEGDSGKNHLYFVPSRFIILVDLSGMARMFTACLLSLK